jgi:chromosome partitioning protein
MFAELGRNVVVLDLDPQANLTSAFLDEEKLQLLWDTDKQAELSGKTVHHCLYPLYETGDLRDPETISVGSHLHLLPGNLALADFEELLSQEWPNSLGSGQLYRPFRILTAFWQLAQMAAKARQADLILIDVGPNLGAINRSALIASDYLLIPLAADLFSIQGLSNLGPTLLRWRKEWNKRLNNWDSPKFELPTGSMNPIGYVLQQHSERLDRPVKAYRNWAERIPEAYRRYITGDPTQVGSSPILQLDPYRLASLKNYRSLVPMGQEAHKPIFKLTSADGAIGSHNAAVQDAYQAFHNLANEILRRIT